MSSWTVRVTVQWRGPSWLKHWGDKLDNTIFHHIVDVNSVGPPVPESVNDLPYLTDRLASREADLSEEPN